MTHSIEIRIANENDVPGIRKAIRSSIEGLASKDYSEDIIQSWGADTPKAQDKQKLAIREGQELTWVAVQGGKIVGFSAFSPQAKELRAVYVCAEVARKGLGTKLLECVEQKARDLGLSSLSMNSSITAAPFYEHHGYSVVGEVIHTLATGTKMTAIEMMKQFGADLSMKESNLVVEAATDKNAVMSFLEKYEETSQFLINNLRECGLTATEDPYSGNFKIIKDSVGIVAVFYVARCGNVYAQAISTKYVDLILEACEQEPFPIKGFLGSWDLLNSCYERYALTTPDFKPSYSSKEILYRLALTLNHPTLKHHSSVRLLTMNDFEKWHPLRFAYCHELQLPFDMSEEQLKARFRQAVENRTWWGYFENEQLFSIAGLNSKSDTIGQIGGVFTPKELRQRGLSKATMLHMLRDCRDLHGLKKSILFTGETDFPAQKLYESIGYDRIGHFALILSGYVSPAQNR